MQDNGASARRLFANAMFKFLIGLDVLALARFDGTIVPPNNPYVLSASIAPFFESCVGWITLYDAALRWLNEKNQAALALDAAAGANNIFADLHLLSDPLTPNVFYLNGNGGNSVEAFSLPPLMAVYQSVIAGMRCGDYTQWQRDQANTAFRVTDNSQPMQFMKAITRSTTTTTMTTTSTLVPGSPNVNEFTQLWNYYLMSPREQIDINATPDRLARGNVAFNFTTSSGEGIVYNCDATSGPPSAENVYTVVGQRIVGLPIALERTATLDLSLLDISGVSTSTDAGVVGEQVLKDIRLLCNNGGVGFRLGIHADFSPTNAYNYSSANGAATKVLLGDRASEDPDTTAEMHAAFVELVRMQRPYCDPRRRAAAATAAAASGTSSLSK